ncbi:MAG: hypothetical protein K8S62_04775 [Candidatus Sabulitectum sp.]|nr:hypothetical protein [Candidatus Sabulitectum sp.]
MALLSGSKKFFLNLLVHRCIGCGSRMEVGKGSFCSWCLVRMYPDGERVVRGIRVFTGFLHSGVMREMILRFKFGGERHLGRELARLTLDSWKETPSGNDTLFPVPISRKRLRERGYNQAALLAAGISRETGAALKDTLIRSGGESQIRVSGTGRVENIRGKFSVPPGTECRGRVWLIDDVMTTGATIAEIVSTLSDAGICQVQPGVVCFRKISKESIINREVNHAGI